MQCNISQVKRGLHCVAEAPESTSGKEDSDVSRGFFTRAKSHIETAVKASVNVVEENPPAHSPREIH